MQMNPLAPCRKNTCSVLAAVAVLFAAMVLRNELGKKKKERTRKSVNKYLNAAQGKALGVCFYCEQATGGAGFNF